MGAVAHHLRKQSSSYQTRVTDNELINVFGLFDFGADATGSHDIPKCIYSIKLGVQADAADPLSNSSVKHGC